MSIRSLAILVITFSSVSIPAAHAQTVYVAPGGVYVGAGPVYVTPAPNVPYVAPPYAPPAYVAPPAVAPTYVAPTVVAPGPAYGVPATVYQTEGPYVAPYEAYGSLPSRVGRARVYVPGDYAAQMPPRPPAAIPNRNARCWYNGRLEYCR